MPARTPLSPAAASLSLVRTDRGLTCGTWVLLARRAPRVHSVGHDPGRQRSWRYQQTGLSRPRRARCGGRRVRVRTCHAGPPPPHTTAPSTGRRAVAESSLPGDPHWEIRHLGAADAISGYAGVASVLTGQSFPLLVSTTSSGFRVRAFRLGWYGGDGARQVWQSGSLRGHRQNAPGLTGSTNTVQTEWDPAVEVPTDDWPAGAYLLRLERGFRRAAVRAGDGPLGHHGGQGRAQGCCLDLAGLQHLGRLRPVHRPGASPTRTGRWRSAWTGRTT